MKKSTRLRDNRKIRYSQEQLKDILRALEEYTESKDFPSLAGFLSLTEVRHKWKLTRQYIYDNPEVFDLAVSVIRAKCEDYLVKQGLAGRSMPMVIFMLKQLQYGGYSDQQQLDVTSQSQPIKFVNLVPRPKTDKKKPTR